jgi:hypothetical protein
MCPILVFDHTGQSEAALQNAEVDCQSIAQTLLKIWLYFKFVQYCASEICEFFTCYTFFFCYYHSFCALFHKLYYNKLNAQCQCVVLYLKHYITNMLRFVIKHFQEDHTLISKQTT